MDITKICVEKLNIPIIRELENSSSPYHSEKLAAAFFIKKIWPKGSIIKVYFIQDPPSNLPRTSIEQITLTSKGRTIDPLQYIVDKMSIKDAIIKIINERIKVIVGIDIQFTDIEYESNVRISFDPDKGSYSSVGTDCLTIDKHTATTNYGWFDVATVIHEFCHVMGNRFCII
jgi:hypothetical protein